MFADSVDNMLAQRSSSDRASRSLAKTGFYFQSFFVFFLGLRFGTFFGWFLEALGSRFGSFWAQFLYIFSNFDDFMIVFCSLVFWTVFGTLPGRPHVAPVQ